VKSAELQVLKTIFTLPQESPAGIAVPGPNVPPLYARSGMSTSNSPSYTVPDAPATQVALPSSS
jgi:hypothetical protein